MVKSIARRIAQIGGGILLLFRDDIPAKTNAELQEELRGHELFGQIGIWLVVVGLGAETWFAIEFRHGKSFLEVWYPIIGSALVYIGVTMELVAHRHSITRERELDRRSEERVAEANERAANAERETERLRSQFGWRAISPSQNAVLVEQLSKFIGPVEILYSLGDHESETYAMLFVGAFGQAGWDITFTGAQFDTLQFGVSVPDNMGELGQPSRAVRGAFILAEIPFVGAPIPSISGLSKTKTSEPRKRFAENPARLYVGPKAHPLVMQSINAAAK